MAMAPPYLFTADDDSITARSEGDFVVLTVRGPWNHLLWHASTMALHECLAEAPAGLIVDLSELIDPDAVSVATWMTAQGLAARMIPPVPLALVVSPELSLATRLQRLRVRSSLPVYAKRHQAQVALTGRLPLTERLTLDLATPADAVVRARSLADDACRAWELPSLRAQSELVAGELAGNAVAHAGPPHTLALTHRGHSVHIAMYDGDPRPPRLRPERGGGLLSVHTAADYWGSMPSGAGKVVWALVQVPSGPR